MKMIGRRVGQTIVYEHAGTLDVIRHYGTEVGKSKYTCEDRFDDALRQEGFTDYERRKALVIEGQRVIPDFVFPGLGLVVEIDGYSHYHETKIMKRDKAKDRLYWLAGWHVVRIPATDLGDPTMLSRWLNRLSSWEALQNQKL